MRGLIVVCALMVVSMLVNQCTKTSGNKMNAIEQLQGQEQRGLMSTKSADCDCAMSQASCSADCWFTECCICFNPATHEAGCGCYLGFSSCKTESITKSEPQVNAHQKEHTIFLKDKRIREFFRFLESKNFRTTGLQEAYGQLVKDPEGWEIKKNEKRIKVGSIRYEQFQRAYTSFMEGIGVQGKREVELYLKSRK